MIWICWNHLWWRSLQDSSNHNGALRNSHRCVAKSTHTRHDTHNDTHATYCGAWLAHAHMHTPCIMLCATCAFTQTTAMCAIVNVAYLWCTKHTSGVVPPPGFLDEQQKWLRLHTFDSVTTLRRQVFRGGATNWKPHRRHIEATSTTRSDVWGFGLIVYHLVECITI